jgi:hypothetical protein
MSKARTVRGGEMRLTGCHAVASQKLPTNFTRVVH